MATRFWFVVLIVCVPSVSWAHGDSGGTTIDEHHAALRTMLQDKLGDAYDTPVAGLDTADADDGFALYGQHCASCHGESGVGDGPASAGLDPKPSNLTNGDQMAFISDAGFMEVIGAGLESTGMPAYDSVLSEQEQLNVYAYTKTLRVTSEEEDDHLCSVIALHNAPRSNHTPAWLALLALGAVVAFRRSRVSG